MREGEQERNRKSCRRERGEGKCVSVTFQRDTRKSGEKREGEKKLYIYLQQWKMYKFDSVCCACNLKCIK